MRITLSLFVICIFLEAVGSAIPVMKRNQVEVGQLHGRPELREREGKGWGLPPSPNASLKALPGLDSSFSRQEHMALSECFLTMVPTWA